MEPDLLFVDRLKVPVRIGTTPAERAFPQVVFISIDIELPLARAGKSDDLRDSVDYAGLTSDVDAFARSREFNLVEALAEGIAAIALNRPAIVATRIRVEKRVLAQARSVGVQICRKKND